MILMTYEVHTRSLQHQREAPLSALVCRGVPGPGLLRRARSVVEPSTCCFWDDVVRGNKRVQKSPQLMTGPGRHAQSGLTPKTDGI
jgi:hypothetical protein